MMLFRESVPVPDPDMEPVEYYKVSKIKVISNGEQGSNSSPWELVPPKLEIYREEDIEDWQLGHMTINVAVAYGEPGCLLRLL